MRYLLIPIITITFFGCIDPKTNSVESKEKVIQVEENASTEPEFFDYGTARFTEQVSMSSDHFFSNNQTKDRFFIEINAGLVTNSKSSILVLNFEGDSIYFEEFPTYYLINGYALDDMKSNNEVLKHILKRAKENIGESSFFKLDSTEHPFFESYEPSDYYDSLTYSNCFENELFIFSFSLGEESTTFYGFSKEEQKATPIMDCC